MNVCEHILSNSQILADHVAITFEGQDLTYADIEHLSACAAERLQRLGVERGDRVGLVIPNVPAFAVWYYATLRLGAIAVSINTRLTGEEMAFILSDSNANVVVGTDTLVEQLPDPLPNSLRHVVTASEDGLRSAGEPLTQRDLTGKATCAHLKPEEPATILYTSGTTGFPKGATLAHRNVRSTMHAHNHLCEMRSNDRILLAVPLFHCYGQNSLLNAGLNVGATLVLQRKFDLDESKRLIHDHQVTKLFTVPTTFQLMLDYCQPEDLRSIEYCFSAAAKLPVQLSQQWLKKFGIPIHEGYGLTESSPFASYNHRVQYRPGSIGTPVDLVEMKVVDPDTGEPCPPGVPGEIAIRGPNVMLGYWNRPEETAAAIRDGWLYTGDIGQTDERNYFYIVDRLKDMIVVGGSKVFPAEVERVLIDDPAVSEAAVVGFPDPVLGEKVVAFVVGEAGPKATHEALRAHCQMHLASFKVPTRFVITEELPRNPAGKVLKKDLQTMNFSELTDAPSRGVGRLTRQRPMWDAVSPTTADVAPPQPFVLIERLAAVHPASRERFLTSYLQDELQALVGLSEKPEADTLFMDTGMDSLLMIEFRDRLQAQIGPRMELAATLVFDHPRIADLAVYLLKSLAPEQESTGGQSTSSTGRANAVKSPQPLQERVEDMTEPMALEALLREVKE